MSFWEKSVSDHEKDSHKCSEGAPGMLQALDPTWGDQCTWDNGRCDHRWHQSYGRVPGQHTFYSERVEKPYRVWSHRVTPLPQFFKGSWFLQRRKLARVETGDMLEDCFWGQVRDYSGFNLSRRSGDCESVWILHLL